VPIAEPTNGEPGTTWTNTTSRPWYQIIPGAHPCAACLQWAYQVKLGPWPIQLHPNCRCSQERIEPGFKAPHPFADFRKMLDEMSHGDRVKVIGGAVYNLLERGVIKWEDAVTRYRIRSLKQIVALQKLSVKTLEANGVRPWLAQAAHAAVHTPEQELVRAARAKSMAALEAAGVDQKALVEVLSKALTGQAKIVGGNPGAPGLATTAGFKPANMSAQARELEAILGAWRAAPVVMVGRTEVRPTEEGVALTREGKTVTVRKGESVFGKTYEEWRRLAER
jgi:hypothetical protein